MPTRPLLCYITDRTQFAGDEATRRKCLLAKITEATQSGVDYIQLREKDLSTRDLEELASAALSILRDSKLRTANREPRTVLLVNSRTDVALAVGADGVHLPSDDISSIEVRNIWGRSRSGSAGAPARATISVSCHRRADVQQAEGAGADLALFAPVFEKKDVAAVRPSGLDPLREACRHKIPVLALGGITLESAASCLEAGAAGIAAIRLFQESDMAEVVRTIRG